MQGKRKKLGLLLGGIVGASLLTLSQAVEIVNGKYVWNFLSGQAWPLGYDQNTGKPDNLTYHRDEYPSEFFQRINNALPESYVNEAFMTDDEGATITLTEEAEVFVTFIHEGAGYKNAFGFFTFDKANPPTSINEVRETIVFPNLSYPHMTNGHRLSLGTFPAGTSIGFMVAANGFSYYDGVKNTAVPYYYSLQDLNPEADPALRQHMVALFDDEVSEVILGFEDLPRTWGDNDFNDAVFSVKTTPETALDTQALVAMPEANDSDADGILDSEDEFPNNYRRAFSSYFPSQTEYTTLAYEDEWPKVGDYDMNDLVIRERLQTTYDANGNISGFILHGLIAARGAANHNGFALRIMDMLPENIADATLTIDGQTFDKATEGFQTDAVIQLWSDSHQFTQTNETGSCSHFNTNKSCPFYQPVSFTLDVTFDGTVSTLAHSDFDFFIFRTDDRSHEIHFAGYAPTDLFDTGRFGRFDDTSDPATGRYFKAANNLPWGLKVSADWYYPREYIDVIWAYPDYETWVESSGELAQDWYLTSDRKSHYYVTE